MSDNTFDIPEEFLNKDEKIFKGNTGTLTKDDHGYYVDTETMVSARAFKAFKEEDSEDKLKMKQKIGELIDTTELLVSRNETLMAKINSLERANERLLWGLCGLTVIVLILGLFVI